MARNANDDPHDMNWNEDRGGPRDPKNLLSFPSDGRFCRATAEALLWEDAGAHSPDRRVIPSVYVERLFKNCKVTAPWPASTTTS